MPALFYAMCWAGYFQHPRPWITSDLLRRTWWQWTNNGSNSEVEIVSMAGKWRETSWNFMILTISYNHLLWEWRWRCSFTGYCITIGGGTICVFVGCDIDVVCSIIVDDYCDVFIDSLLVFSPVVDCCLHYNGPSSPYISSPQQTKNRPQKLISLIWNWSRPPITKSYQTSMLHIIKQRIQYIVRSLNAPTHCYPMFLLSNAPPQSSNNQCRHQIVCIALLTSTTSPHRLPIAYICI